MQKLYRIQIEGSVQGLGFRPFVFRLANKLSLKGWVQNSAQGVLVEAEGDELALRQFLHQLEDEKPAQAIIYKMRYSIRDIRGYRRFDIIESEISGEKSAIVLPDIATCSTCLAELFNSSDRRYRYPFINCIHCGPRFSIIENIPYDRCNTSMRTFTMCPECHQEYHDPLNRRFHAQPNACPSCGPKLECWNSSGEKLQFGDAALNMAVDCIKDGKIVALKGLGGFQLIVDAFNDNAVNELRTRKHRFEKPFALMYPDLDQVRQHCFVSDLEENLLKSSTAPIVILEKKHDADHLPSSSVGPGNPNLGIMLPNTPLHHLLMHDLNSPVVATSGNLSEEPICIDENDALTNLSAIADYFLVHDRPIVRQVDDSVIRIMGGREQVWRRGRGFAPLPITMNKSFDSMLATGAHLKNTIALTKGNHMFCSQHIGDLSTEKAFTAFKKVIDDFSRMYETKPEKIICDLHPEYLSTKHAQSLSLQPVQVQHHCAHVLSCMADNELDGAVLGIAWDGTGYGTDGRIWGSEFLVTSKKGFERIGHFRDFMLPGGEAAIRHPARQALGLLYEILGNDLFSTRELLPLRHFSEREILILKGILNKQINSPYTCSAGRVFDAVASIIGLRHESSFEGQAAMDLEFASARTAGGAYSFEIKNLGMYLIDWEPMILEIVADLEKNIPREYIAAKFHHTLTEIILGMCTRAGLQRVVLTGGCFQNKYLTEDTIGKLRLNGIIPYWHRRIPPNDGGIAVGQIMAGQFCFHGQRDFESTQPRNLEFEY